MIILCDPNSIRPFGLTRDVHIYDNVLCSAQVAASIVYSSNPGINFEASRDGVDVIEVIQK